MNARRSDAEARTVERVTDVPGPRRRDADARPIWLGIAAAGFLALLLAGAGVVAYSLVDGRVERLESRLADAEERLRMAERDVAVAQTAISSNAEGLKASGEERIGELKAEAEAATAALNQKLAGANARIRLVTDCLPELQGQLNGLSVATSQNVGYLTGAWLSNPLQVSRVCQPLLLGTPRN